MSERLISEVTVEIEELKNIIYREVDFVHTQNTITNIMSAIYILGLTVKDFNIKIVEEERY